MEKYGIRVDILPNYFLQLNNVYNVEEAIKLSGLIAGICYDEEGFNNLVKEPLNKTLKRVDMTLNHGHHSVYDHLVINLNIQNLPKILAMVINNENQFTTSEKSARYTSISKDDYNIISNRESELYYKWLEIFETKIKEVYGDVFKNTKIHKLAQENARYLVTVFMPTQMVYSTSLRQINYLTSWMQKYINNADLNNNFEYKLVEAMKELIAEFERINILVPGLLKNEKNRSISLFGNNLDEREIHFGNVYSTLYNASFAAYAQLQRHRSLDYQLEMTKDKNYYIPPIIENDNFLVNDWLKDMNSVKDINPQGELVKVYETGQYERFILKCQERLCSEVQLETMRLTRDTLLRYKAELEKTNSYLAKDIEKYSHGARCTFPTNPCTMDCHFKEGKTLVRKI